jgi:tetratricopeptide (TPR) repeat protein
MRTTHGRRVPAWLGWIALLAVAHLARPASSQTGASPSRNLCVDGVRLVQSGDTTRAETLLVAQLARNPSDPCALTNLGNLARLRGDYEQARVLYRMAMRADSSDVGIRLNYAAVLHELKDPAADSLYLQALQGASTLDEIYNKLGITRSAAADSLKGADINVYLGVASPGTRRPPDRYVQALLNQAYHEERQGRAVSQRNATAQVASTNSAHPNQPERAKARAMVIASLPVYWKN